jgi:hypothetical protein
MDALAEGDMPREVGPIRIERVSLREHTRVAIGRGEMRHDAGAGRNGDAANLGVTHGGAEQPLRRRFEPQNFLDGARCLFRVEQVVAQMRTRE